MQRHVMSKHRNAGAFKKYQRFGFEHPFTSMIAGMTGAEKRPGLDLYYSKLQRQFTFPRRESFGIIHNGSLRIQKR